MTLRALLFNRLAFYSCLTLYFKPYNFVMFGRGGVGVRILKVSFFAANNPYFHE